MLEIFKLLAYVNRGFHSLQPFHVLHVSLFNPLLLAHPDIDVERLVLDRLNRLHGSIFASSCICTRFACIFSFVVLLKVLQTC